jgi:hypothetical protein
VKQALQERTRGDVFFLYFLWHFSLDLTWKEKDLFLLRKVKYFPRSKGAVDG